MMLTLKPTRKEQEKQPGTPQRLQMVKGWCREALEARGRGRWSGLTACAMSHSGGGGLYIYCRAAA